MSKQVVNKGSFSRRQFLRHGAIATALAATGFWYWPNRWNFIVIHHSAGNYGNIKFLQEVHRQRQSKDPVDAIPYHFVIGNGNGMPMGEVASDWRREHNLWGAHVSGNNSDRNFRGFGICLIGNFEQYSVPELQYDSLIGLCRSLMNEYSIHLDNISGHGKTKGESTLCPGRKFPFKRLYNDLGQTGF